MRRELRTLNGENKLSLWAERVSECRNSGQNVKDWCKENGIYEQTYYRWQKRLLEMAKTQQEAQFAEVTPVKPVYSSLQFLSAIRLDLIQILVEKSVGRISGLRPLIGAIVPLILPVSMVTIFS